MDSFLILAIHIGYIICANPIVLTRASCTITFLIAAIVTQTGYWSSPAGCRRCECDPDGSVSSNCHDQSGRCRCKEGVGGDLCDDCLRGYYGFSAAGCKGNWTISALWLRSRETLSDRVGESNEVCADKVLNRSNNISSCTHVGAFNGD